MGQSFHRFEFKSDGPSCFGKTEIKLDGNTLFGVQRMEAVADVDSPNHLHVTLVMVPDLVFEKATVDMFTEFNGKKYKLVPLEDESLTPAGENEQTPAEPPAPAQEGESQCTTHSDGN